MQGWGVEDMEFPGLSQNSIWNFQWLMKNEVEFPSFIKKKKCGICSGLCFWPWNF